jgi:uncharacterized membrane protein (DUF2068 family)
MEAGNPHRTPLLVLIAITKLAEAALLLAVAFGAHRLLHADVEQIVTHWARAVRVDPDNRFAHAVLSRVTGLSDRRLTEISVGTLMYGLLFSVEGAGLLLGRRWAEWVTVVSTAGFLPVEVYEVIRQVHIVRVLVLVLNLLIVIYLIRRLVRPAPRATPAT